MFFNVTFRVSSDALPSLLQATDKTSGISLLTVTLHQSENVLDRKKIQYNRSFTGPRNGKCEDRVFEFIKTSQTPVTRLRIAEFLQSLTYNPTTAGPVLSKLRRQTVSR